MLFFDAVDLLIPACELQYGRMRDAASYYSAIQERLTESHDDDADNDSLREHSVDIQAALLAEAGAFVSTIQRLRRVVKRLRSDATLRIAKKSFESSVRSCEKARHYLEHLDTAIPAIVPTGHGALGGMAWHYANESDQHACFFIIPGHLGEGATVTIRMERSIRRPVDHLWATIGGADYYLTGAADAIEALRQRLSNWSQQWMATEG